MFPKRYVQMLFLWLALSGLLGKPVRADLTLTAAGTAAGFHLSTFATGFPTFNNGGYLEGPLGIAFLSNGSVLVTNVNGEVRLFPNDADGQNTASALITASYSLANAIGLVRIGNAFYTTQQANNVVAQVDSDGTIVQSIANVSSPTGLAVNPNNSHLFVSTLGVNQIVDIDPIAKTANLFVNANADGIATDGTVLYAAVNTDQIIGYRISDGAVVFTSSTIDNVDGLALGTGVLKGFLFANTWLGDVYQIDLATGTQTLIANGGSRGDFITVDPNGSLLVTQSSSIARLFLNTPFDFNRDGHPDLLLQNPATGRLAAWFLNGASVLGGSYITPAQDPHWKAVGIGDFNRDGQPDILFQNTSTGQLSVWLMHGTTAFQGVYVTPGQDPSWQVVGVADFNGDGWPDILFQNASIGKLAIWYMNGIKAIGGAYLASSPPANWKAVGIGDFNRDGQPDILFQNSSTGQLNVWYMRGAAVAGSDSISPTQNPAWKAVALADVNADGPPDIVFQNQSTGRLAIWFMSGATATGGAYLQSIAPSGWQVVGPH